MKKMLGLAFAGLMLVACGGSNRNATGMQETTAATNSNPQGDQTGGGSSIGSGQGNMAGSSTGPTGSGGSNSEQQDSQASSPTSPPNP
jgi:hypothetical protein